jgi:hypothetical protein
LTELKIQPPFDKLRAGSGTEKEEKNEIGREKKENLFFLRVSVAKFTLFDSILL